ncbi:hypothetical protein BJ508DRAFT_328229 [Ascobolus immersus RN42]|uniref:Uncharacterized protein n=1 Tax=Ascobolus immersus RN42 TaxID=1160509 RepID=A0A3N4I239_ASCIM|nr:hypothetical protein BJ508DRAFT_328229 [Ascobolus immersus RN42]
MSYTQLRCGGCNQIFDSMERKKEHIDVATGHRSKIVENAYRWIVSLDEVNIGVSSDMEFYCAIEGCDFSSVNECRLRAHCSTHKSLTLKGNVQFLKHTTKKGLFGPYKVPVYTYTFETKTKQDRIDESNNSHAALSSSLPTVNAIEAPQVAVSNSNDAATSPPSLPSQDNSDAATIIVEFTSEIITNAEPATECFGINEMKAALRAKYNKTIFDEALRTMMEKVKIYMEKTMERLG